MLKEEKAMREEILMRYSSAFIRKRYARLVTALVKAVREDCAKVVEGCGNDELYEAIADAVRKGKPVQQCTYCGEMKYNITSNGECRTCRSAHL